MTIFLTYYYLGVMISLILNFIEDRRISVSDIIFAILVAWVVAPIYIVYINLNKWSFSKTGNSVIDTFKKFLNYRIIDRDKHE
jgi:hypothetical protein